MTIFLFLAVGGRRELPFAGYSVVARQAHATLFFEIVRDDRRGDEALLIAAFHHVEPRTTKIGRCRSASKFPGGHRGRVTPVPIPNTEVKPATADGTACVGVWESRSLPGLFFNARFVS